MTSHHVTTPESGQIQISLPGVKRTNGAAYLYDGTFEGLFSAIFAATVAHDQSADLVREGDLQLRMDQEVIPVTTNMTHAQRIRRTVICACGGQTFDSIWRASTVHDPDIPLIIHRFIQYALQQNNPCKSCAKRRSCTRPCRQGRNDGILDDLGDPLVWQLTKAVRAANNEAERMRQFIRFEHCEGDVWFARCNPKASVVPLVMDWFVGRFNAQRFVIYDEVAQLSGVWDGRRSYFVKGDGITVPPHSAEEEGMQQAWINFWNSVSLDVRYNPELQRSFMPKRLWGNITEMKTRMPAQHSEQAYIPHGRNELDRSGKTALTDRNETVRSTAGFDIAATRYHAINESGIRPSRRRAG